MSENWYVAMKSGDFSRISKKFHIDPVVARVLRNREIISDEAIEMFLNGGIESLYDPHLMKDVDRTCEILEEKIRNGEKIRILGDYDIDGVTSTYILYRGIRTVGGRVDTVIPNRMTDGYGLNAKLIQDALEDGIDTLITCDNGISAAAEIAQGRAGGMTILVTDHHDLPFEWKEDGSRRYSSCGADAVVNPKQEDCNYPFQGLCGAGVAFKVVQVLYERFHVEPEELMALLPYAAMGTVGDVVDLVDENRVLVKCGLKRLNEQPDLALQALIEACNLTPGTITAYHIGFVLGPCINASGRLDTAKRALELLQSKDREQAAALAAELVELNTTRKKMTEEYCQQALQIIHQEKLEQDSVLLVYLPECHESIAGIIAGRIKEIFHKPAFVVTKSGELAKGSGRSIEAYSMYDEMVKVKDCFLKFGGHKLAAGMSLEVERVQELRRRLNENSSLTEEDFKEKIKIDVPMPMSYVTQELMEQFSKLEPFGKANPKPLFAEKNLTLKQYRVLGEKQNVVQVVLKSPQGIYSDCIFFGNVPDFVEFCKRKESSRESINVTYQPHDNEYHGRHKKQMIIRNYA